MLDSQTNFEFDTSGAPSFDGGPVNNSLTVVKPSARSTSSVVAELRDKGEDFEFYPTTDEQIETILSDMQIIADSFELSPSLSQRPSILDIGAGDGRVLLSMRDAINANVPSHKEPFDAFAIEKASVHTATYAENGITLLGSCFHETNLVSKKATFAFSNPPYSEFSAWIERIINELNFHVLYAVIPKRWREDEAIKAAMKRRNLKFSKVLDESDFKTADRKARGEVDVVRFSFIDLSDEAIKEVQEDNEFRWEKFKDYRSQSIYTHTTDPFELFLENELGLKQTHSKVTQKFVKSNESDRIKKSLKDEESECYALVKSEGLLPALLNSYEKDMEHVLEQYKLIGQLDGAMLAELGVEHDNVKHAIKEKLFGYRSIYWSLLFDHFTVLKQRISTKHKNDMLRQLNNNSLDFTMNNALYVIDVAVKITNEKTEETLVDVFLDLSNEESILRYYKSNEHIYKDNWRFMRSSSDNPARLSKRVLDYRFVYTAHSNFKKGDFNAIEFCNDLMVMFRLLGYSDIAPDKGYDEVDSGTKLTIMGNLPSGERIELVQLKFYYKGTRHIRFNQEAMLRLNVTVSRILGWVRTKQEFEDESGCKNIKDNIWSLSDNLNVLPSHVLALTNKAG
jgi:hypothetical protein